MILAGGTGLYLEAVLKGYRIADVPEDAALREGLMRRGTAELVTQLRQEDPSLAARTDLGSKKRVVRALEIAAHSRRAPVRCSGPPPVEMQAQVFAVDIARRELHRRIDSRLEERLGQGLVEEVHGLLEGGLPRERMMQLGLEYREVTSYLAGEKNFDRMKSDLMRGIHLFAKRQQTWFRGLERRGIAVTWIGPGDRAAILAACRRGRPPRS